MLIFKIIPGYVLGFYLVIQAAINSDTWMMVAAGGVFLLNEIYASLLRQGTELFLIRMNSMMILRSVLPAEKDKKEDGE